MLRSRFDKLRLFIDLSGEEAFTKRTEGNEPDPEFFSVEAVPPLVASTERYSLVNLR